jgi:predicted alpha/beta-hydrolase family hydrolase
MLTAEDPTLVPPRTAQPRHAMGDPVISALLLLSYPLHPPQKRSQLRTAHFPSLRTPALFVHGTRDGFATEAELEEALKLIPAPVRLLSVAGAGHDLGFGAKKQPPDARTIVNEFLAQVGFCETPSLGTTML